MRFFPGGERGIVLAPGRWKSLHHRGTCRYPATIRKDTRSLRLAATGGSSCGSGCAGIRVASAGWIVDGCADIQRSRRKRGHCEISRKIWRRNSAGGVSLQECGPRDANPGTEIRDKARLSRNEIRSGRDANQLLSAFRARNKQSLSGTLRAGATPGLKLDFGRIRRGCDGAQRLPRAKNFGNRPRLSDRSHRCEWRVSREKLA